MSDKPFTKANLNDYLKDLAKEFKKRNGRKTPAEIVLIGGASILINYGFRELTYDLDAIISASSAMKESINAIGDMYGLPTGWLNTDFVRTASYSSKILLYSKYYRTYSNILTIRTITGEYLLAMKLKSGRQYKYDLSDIVGILCEQEKAGKPLTLDDVKRAVIDLYDSYDVISDRSKDFIEYAFKYGDYNKLYKIVRDQEKENKEVLLDFQERYPNVMNFDNINDIIDSARKKKQETADK